MQKCIYCLRCLSASAFNTEHVLSRAFGKFKDAPVLRCVCKECNQFFGDKLEVRFARGGFEGLLRYRNRVKTPACGPVHLQYVELTIPEGDWEGVRMKLVKDDIELRVRLIPQVGFHEAENRRWINHTIDEITAGALAASPHLKKSEMRIYAPSLQDHEDILQRLKEAGVNFTALGTFNPPAYLLSGEDIPVEVNFTVNLGIRRCIAKYAFNYLAFVCGQSFVMASDFDDIRNFIRFGSVTPYPAVVETFKPILQTDSPTRRQTNGHLLTLEWEGANLLMGQVSLFNYLTYRVNLANGFRGLIWRPIRDGLYFNIEDRTVRRLTPISTRLLL
jgi:hypothetical protein